jgi:hypothetical protein
MTKVHARTPPPPELEALSAALPDAGLAPEPREALEEVRVGACSPTPRRDTWSTSSSRCRRPTVPPPPPPLRCLGTLRRLHARRRTGLEGGACRLATGTRKSGCLRARPWLCCSSGPSLMSGQVPSPRRPGARDARCVNCVFGSPWQEGTLETAPARLRRRQLELAGYRVVVLPHWEWRAEPGLPFQSAGATLAVLRRLLDMDIEAEADIPLPPPAAATPAGATAPS